MSHKLAFIAASAFGLIMAGSTAAQPVAGGDSSDQWNWTGPYAGVNVGYGRGDFRYPYAGTTDIAGTMPASGRIRQHGSGVIGGAQVGYNFQGPGWLLLGLETDFQGTGLSASGSYTGTATNGSATSGDLRSSLRYLGTVRGRIGVPVMDGRLVPYVTGGFAYGSVRNSGDFACASCGTGGTPLSGAYGASSVHSGWTAGAGLEYGLTRHASMKVEYLYTDLGRHNIYGPSGDLTAGGAGLYNATVDAQTRANIVRVGLNWRF